MASQPLTPAEVRRALALIEKGHLLEGQQVEATSLDRARRVLTGELGPEEARIEVDEALRALVARETAAKVSRYVLVRTDPKGAP